MTDFRNIIALETNMELEQTIAQNNSLQISNKFLVNLTMVIVITSAIAIAYFVNENRKIRSSSLG
jgi:hypothetical protein